MPRLVESPEYNAYRSAKARCNNSSHCKWSLYGGRGIKFLFSSFPEFLAEVGLKPEKGMVLDRENNDGNYEKGNIRWVYPKLSLENRRQTQALKNSLKNFCKKITE